MFLLISGVSGSGKQTVINYILSKYTNAVHFKSCTTRPRRSPDEDDYIFLSQQEFLKRRENGEFFETEEVHGFYYGVLKKSLQDIIDHKNILYLKDVDVHGAEKIYKELLGKADVTRLFIDVPDDILFERLLGRGESEERAKTRISRGKMEREYKKDYEFVIENIKLEETYKQVEKILKKIDKNKILVKK